MQKVDKHRVTHLAYFLRTLKAVKEGEKPSTFSINTAFEPPFIV